MKKNIILIYILLTAVSSYAYQSSYGKGILKGTADVSLKSAIKGETFDNDYTVDEISIPVNNYINTPIDVKGSFTNTGVQPITSIDISYQIDNNGYVETYTLDDIHIEIGNSQQFSHNIPMNIQNTGSYTVTVVLSNPNGIDSVSRSNSKEFNIIENAYVRNVLVEEFSTERCPNCPPVATYLNNIAEKNDNVILMVHHTGYYSDDYTIDESVELKVFYNSNTYAPAAMMDRHYNGLANDFGGDVNPGPVFWPGNPYGGRRIDSRLALPSYVDVNIEGTYNQETREISVNVTGMFKDDFTDQLGVSLWIIEDGIVSFEQAGQSGKEWTHHGVVRAALSETFGDSITTLTNIDETYSASYQYTIPDDFIDRNLSLVAFVNKMNTDINECDILNSNSIEISSFLQHFKTTFTVSDKDNLPIANATITIDDNELESTDENGNVEIMLLDGTYNYKIEKYGYELALGEFTIVDAEEAIEVELSSKIKTTFNISDINKDPLSRAYVEVVGVGSKVTDNNGETEFMLSSGTYTYKIKNDGYVMATSEFTLADEDKVIEVELIEISDTAKVTFKITNINNAPVSDANVQIDGYESIKTDENGEIYIRLPVGTYNYLVEKEGYTSFTDEFTLDTDDKDVEVTLNKLVGNLQSNLKLDKVYPNPFKDELIIEYNSIENSEVIVYDIAGNVHFTVGATKSKTIIPTSNFDNGVYFIKIFNNNNQNVFKVIK